MIRPYLIIGVGGSGGKTIRAMIQAFERKFESVGYSGGIPVAWQFLQIDTTYDGEIFPARMLDKSNFHSVVRSGLDFNGLVDNLMKGANNSEQQELFSGWGIPKSIISWNRSKPDERALGRMAGVSAAASTLRAIQNSKIGRAHV